MHSRIAAITAGNMFCSIFGGRESLDQGDEYARQIKEFIALMRARAPLPETEAAARFRAVLDRSQSLRPADRIGVLELLDARIEVTPAGAIETV